MVQITFKNMIDFYYIIHYVVYRYYRTHKESYIMSMLYACGLHMILSFTLIGNIDYFVCLLLGTPFHVDKLVAWGFIIFWVIVEYMVFFRNDIYIEIFDEYNKQTDTQEMKSKCKKAKIFNFSLLVINILLLIIVDYLNHHQ